MGASLFLLVCAGAVAIGPLAAQTAMARWFYRRRGRAMGFVTAATSMGGVVIAPLMAYLIGWFDWRGALLAMGAIVVVLITLIAWLVIRDDPADVGLTGHPELALAAGAGAGGETTAAAPPPPAERTWTRLELAKTRNFWCLLLGIGLNLGIMNAMLGVTLVPYVTDMGISRESAAFLISCLSISGVLGKIVNGALSDYVDRRWLVVAASAFTVAFLGILQAQPGYPLLFAACCLAGLAIGSVMPVWGALIADCFGTRTYGTAIGFMSASMLPIHLFTVRFAGESFDRTGSYDLALRSFAAMAVVAIVFILLVRLPRADRGAGISPAPVH
jgi:sugar phosphate permease